MSRTSSPRRFQNTLDKWHYSKCSEIKIHFYVKNLYMGNQGEDQFLHFVKERVQKAGPCEVIQITDKNQNERTIDIAIGMRYDNDAKLIYIGKKHINLISKFQGDKKIMPAISEIFLMMLRERGEVDKQALEEKLRQQRFGDKKKERSSSRNSSESYSVEKKKLPPAIVLNPQLIQREQEKTIVPTQLGLQPVQLMSIECRVITVPRESIYIFGIPAEFTLKDCLEDIKNRYALANVPEGMFKCEKQQDHVFEYLEVQLDTQFKNIPLKIRNVPCLVCQKKKKTDTFADILRQYQLFVKTQHPVNTNRLLNFFSKYGDIIGLYELLVNSEESSNSHCILYTSELALKQLNPPGQLELPDEKTTCDYRIPDQNFVSFQRIPYKSTLYAQIKHDTSSSSSSSSSSSVLIHDDSSLPEADLIAIQGRRNSNHVTNYQYMIDKNNNNNNNNNNRRRQNVRKGNYYDN